MTSKIDIDAPFGTVSTTDGVQVLRPPRTQTVEKLDGI